MKEFFILANSFAAPFVSDQSFHHVVGDAPLLTLEEFAKRYDHPCGLYAANCYASADAFHKGEKPLACWQCNRARNIAKVVKETGFANLQHVPQTSQDREGHAEMS